MIIVVSLYDGSLGGCNKHWRIMQMNSRLGVCNAIFENEYDMLIVCVALPLIVY